MKARRAAIMLGIAASVTPRPADAGTEFPVFVTVVGHGAIRLRLAAGRAAPCDSSANRMIFEGWVGVGTRAWATASDFVCVEHTSGALRDADWSVAAVVPTVGRRGPRGSSLPVEIRISTD